MTIIVPPGTLPFHSTVTTTVLVIVSVLIIATVGRSPPTRRVVSGTQSSPLHSSCRTRWRRVPHTLGLWCTLPTVCSPEHRPPGSQRGQGPSCRLEKGSRADNFRLQVVYSYCADKQMTVTSVCVDRQLSFSALQPHSAPPSVRGILPVGRGPMPYWPCFYWADK